MQGINFQIGELFPLPIVNQGEGAMFQVDGNGAMFILQLARTDVIAHEAFRHGKMEFALFEEDGILFLLYQIDGIFAAWGDAPLVLNTLKAELLPTEKSLEEKILHSYLVDPTLQILLSMREVKLSEDFLAIIKKHLTKLPADYPSRIQAIYQKYSPEQMHQRRLAELVVPFNLEPNAR